MVSDRILGGACVALAAFFIWAATRIELSFISDPVGPRTFPIIIGVLVGLCGLAIMLKPDPDPEWPATGRMIEIAAAFLSWRLGAGPLQAAIAGVTISLGIYVVFHLILGLSLARGPLGF